MEKKKENFEWEKELVYNTVYLPVRFFKKEAYIHLDHYKEVRDKRENAVKELEEENKKLKEKLEQIKETYIRFEDSEKEYNKWLWELDQLIMNR